MKNYRIIFFGFIACIQTSAFGQQMPQYSQYLRNQFIVNPAAAGVLNFSDITVSGRMQWVGFENAPKTTYGSFTTVVGKNREVYNPSIRTHSGPVRNPEIKTGNFKHALGGQFISDQYGAFQKINFSGTYALHLPLSKKVNLAFGAKLGYTNNSFDRNKALVNDQNSDALYNEFTNTNLSRNVMNIGSGLYLYSNKFFFGFSADNLTRDLITFGTGIVNFDTEIHANVTGGYKIKINDNLTLTPSFLVQYMNPSPVSATFSAQLEYKEWMWCGVSYRNKDAVIGMVGLNISKRFKFGYSYDYSISKVNTSASGGHELVLGIMLR